MSKPGYVTERQRLNAKYRSTTHYILSGIIPYTEANLKLAFKPNAFFNDLEKLDKSQRRLGTIRTSYYRALKKGLIEYDERGIPVLTDSGQAKLKRYQPRRHIPTARHSVE